MNEKTEQLLQSLAEKLGTTVEYLWIVLVNQAKYHAIISLIQMAFIFAIVFTTIKLHIKFSKKIDGKNTIYYDKEELVIIPMVLAAITSVILLMFFLAGTSDLFSAIFNPEYWALKRIMSF